SDFLIEMRDIIERAATDGDPCGEIEQWAPAPSESAVNPLRDNVVECSWPIDPAGSRRGDVDRGAALVAQALTAAAEDLDDRHGWAADVDALLTERERAQERAPLDLPPQLSVSTLVDLGSDRSGALQRLQRRL